MKELVEILKQDFGCTEDEAFEIAEQFED